MLLQGSLQESTSPPHSGHSMFAAYQRLSSALHSIRLRTGWSALHKAIQVMYVFGGDSMLFSNFCEYLSVKAITPPDALALL